jgi:acyl-CoA hydrolase
LLPIQSGIGNIANAVVGGLAVSLLSIEGPSHRMEFSLHI